MEPYCAPHHNRLSQHYFSATGTEGKVYLILDQFIHLQALPCIIVEHDDI